jgi:hypothetical protein
MIAPAEQPSVHQQLQDWLFARLAGFELPVPNVSAEAANPPSKPKQPEPEPEHSDTPPAIHSEADVRVATEWLRRERARLEDYTKAQLGTIQREREALARQKCEAEQALFLRVQELSRKEEMVLAQGRALQEQAGDLSSREQRLATQLEQAVKDQPAPAQGVEPSPAHDELLATLKAETEALHYSREVAREELRNLIKATEDLRRTREEEEENLRSREAHLQQRLNEADQAILAAQQRQADLEDLELRLHHEVQEQERELVRQRQELEMLQRHMRTSPPRR